MVTKFGTRARVDSSGRITIPVAYRKALGVRPGDEVMLQLEDGSIRVYSRAQALRRLQDRVAKLVPKGVSLAEELINERRKQAWSG